MDKLEAFIRRRTDAVLQSNADAHLREAYEQVIPYYSTEKKH